MSDFVLFSLGKTLNMKEVKNWKPFAPLTLFKKWIGINNRHMDYIKLYCEQNASYCDISPEIQTTGEIHEYLRKTLTKFALLHRSVS